MALRIGPFTHTEGHWFPIDLHLQALNAWNDLLWVELPLDALEGRGQREPDAHGDRFTRRVAHCEICFHLTNGSEPARSPLVILKTIRIWIQRHGSVVRLGRRAHVQHYFLGDHLYWSLGFWADIAAAGKDRLHAHIRASRCRKE